MGSYNDEEDPDVGIDEANVEEAKSDHCHLNDYGQKSYSDDITCRNRYTHQLF